MQRIEYFGRMAINTHGRQSNSQQGLQLMIKCSVNEPGKTLLESVDLNSIEEPANTRNTKPTVRLGCSFHELWGQPYFCFPLPDPVLQVWVCGSDFFLTSQIGDPLNLIVYSKTCLKRPLKNTKNCLFFQDRLSHNAGQKYCRMLPGSILQYFRPAFIAHLS